VYRKAVPDWSRFSKTLMVAVLTVAVFLKVVVTVYGSVANNLFDVKSSWANFYLRS